jgi:hypothetical protein
LSRGDAGDAPNSVSKESDAHKGLDDAFRHGARLPNLAELQDKARACNRRILEAERAGTKLHNRLLRPLLAAAQPQAPPELRSALRTINHQIDNYITTPASARLRENLTQTSRS